MVSDVVSPIIACTLTHTQTPTEQTPELQLQLGLHGGVDAHPLGQGVRELGAYGEGVGAGGGGEPHGVVTDEHHVKTILRITFYWLLLAPALP